MDLNNRVTWTYGIGTKKHVHSNGSTNVKPFKKNCEKTWL